MTKQQIINYFSEKYGTDIFSRLKKLREEMNELTEAEIDYADIMSASSIECLKDELSDVLAVAIHTAHLLGETSETMLNRAYEKAKIRENNPEYKHSELKAENEALRQSGTTDGTDGVSFVSNLDRAIMRLEADQSLNESVDLKRDKLIEAKNIVADILAHSR